MFDFSKVVDRHGTWCTQWDYVADRFGTADLLPFTISDMDFATAPCIIEALNQRLMHGVFGYSRWKNDEFLAAIAHWFSTQHYTAIDTQSVVYGPSVIYMVSELIRQWSETGEGVVIHTPAYDAFYKAIEGNQRTVMPVALEKQADGWFCDMGKLEAVLAKPECKIMLLCSPQNPTGKVWTCDELEIMADLCERHGVRVISDEIHMDMVWGKQPHIPWSNVARGVDRYFEQQVSLAAFTDATPTTLDDIPVTWASTPARELGITLADRMMQKITHEETHSRNLIIPARLIAPK
jgi:cysteine-S-conjugate beta-lyase